MWTHTSNGSMVVQHVRTEYRPLVRGGAIAIVGTRVELVPEYEDSRSETIKKVFCVYYNTHVDHVGEPPVVEAWEQSSISPQTPSQWTAPPSLTPPSVTQYVAASSPLPLP